jgi:hypothetical protein
MTLTPGPECANVVIPAAVQRGIAAGGRAQTLAGGGPAQGRARGGLPVAWRGCG